MHNFGQCSLKASFMHTAITRAHGVGKAVHSGLVASGWLQCHLHLYAVLLLGNANDVLEQRRTGTCGEIAHIIGQAFTRIENAPNLLIGGIIPGIQVKSHTAIEIGASFQAAFNSLKRVIGFSVKDRTII